MNLENIGKDCPCYEVDCSDIMFDIGEFCGLPPNNGKLTIQVNGSTVGDFSANQQEDETINITTPTSQDIADAVDGEARLRAEADNTLQSNINAEELARQRADRDIQAVLDGESLARVNEDRNLQSQIDAIASKSDVVDVVGTYAELQAYDTSKLNDNDVVKVLDDSTHNDAMTYYRWNKTTQTWSYIGQESPYYSKSQTDGLLAQKQDNLTAGTGITLNGSTISADTTVLAVKSELSNYAEKDNTYTKTEVDNLVEPKLSVEVVEQLPVQGDQNKLYLTEKAHTTQTATGNPITATITDGAGQIEDFQLDGDTYQQSYEGWNIIDVDFESVTSYGVTKTLNADKTITLNGKINAGLNFTFGKNITFDTNSQYTLKVEVLRGSSTPYTNDGLPNHQWAVMVNMGLSSQGWQSYAVMCADDVTTVTFTPAQSTGQPRFWFGYNASTADETTGIFNDYTLRISVKKGTTISGYEPFVGGIASPNPTYPQPIQVVTGEQTVSKVGKNLFNKATITTGAYLTTDGGIAPTTDYDTTDYIAISPSTTYYLPKTSTRRLKYYNANKVALTNYWDIASGATGQAITTPSGAYYVRFSFDNRTTDINTFQFEAGSTPTAYAPYSKTDYPISLGSIELCKLGTYQDYIYKDGDTWKVHKATNKTILDGSSDEGWILNTAYPTEYMCNKSNVGITAPSGSTASMCSAFIVTSVAPATKGKYRIGGSYLPLNYDNGDGGVDAFKTWLAQHNMTIYATLATPTDTAITDQTLIAQLEAIRTASLENGSNTITNTATGSNLAGDMEVDYFGYDPTNRYDKWLWLDINNAYEKLGS